MLSLQVLGLKKIKIKLGKEEIITLKTIIPRLKQLAIWKRHTVAVPTGI